MGSTSVRQPGGGGLSLPQQGAWLGTSTPLQYQQRQGGIKKASADTLHVELQEATAASAVASHAVLMCSTGQPLNNGSETVLHESCCNSP
jgi:hypothetical protein